MESLFQNIILITKRGLIQRKKRFTSSSAQCDVTSSTVGAIKHSSNQSSVIISPNDSIHIQLSIEPCLQLSSDSEGMDTPTTPSP